MSHSADFGTLDKVRAQVGREVFLTDWVAILQERIDQFARATDDFQWIHVDTERAARSSPFGGTIAHGFLTLSLLGKFYDVHLSLPFCEMGINYGLNKVRFTNPVRAGGKVRGRFVLSKLEDIPGGLQLTFGVTIEIEGQDKPACIAESVVRQYFRADGRAEASA
jgi:acyl dehydratase